ncbi:unnamed protein product [Dovyalis caffra]|uniref:Uncharacterized protein n=1 Tax=Dovyalis caffra TaxID=77055 RepID=A0AAV1S1T0_9ROSI|nr:unnamed protein product [Dovyalis caffra]
MLIINSSTAGRPNVEIMGSRNGSSCPTLDDDTDGPKTTSRSVSSDFAASYWYYSRETPELKAKMESRPSRAGNIRHSEEKMRA